MKAARILLLIAMVVGSLAVGGAASAAEASLAAPVASGAAPVAGAVQTGGVRTDVVVDDSSWATMPGVTCTQAQASVMCTPDDPKSTSEMQCFSDVISRGVESVVCTTFEGNVEAIRASGGEELTWDLNCTFGDVYCVVLQGSVTGSAILTQQAFYAVADVSQFTTTGGLWDSATGQWSFWVWAVWGVVFVAMIWAIASAAISKDREELVGALVRSAIAIPAVPLSLWVTGLLIDVSNELSTYIVGDKAAMFADLQALLTTYGAGNLNAVALITIILLVSALLLLLVFSFRNLALAALVMAGPIAWMVLPVRRIGMQWVVSYASALVVLLLTGPLTLSFVKMILSGLGQVSTLWDARALPLLIGLILVAFAPFALFGLFSFVGGAAADQIGSRLGSGAAGNVRGAAQTAAYRARMPGPRSGGPIAGTTGRPGAATAGAASTGRGAGRAAAPAGGAGMSAASSGRSGGAASPSGAPAGRSAGAASPSGPPPGRPTAAGSPPSSTAPRPGPRRRGNP